MERGAAQFERYPIAGNLEKVAPDAYTEAQRFLEAYPLTQEAMDDPDVARCYEPVLFWICAWANQAADKDGLELAYEKTTEFLSIFPDASDVYAQTVALWRMQALQSMPDKPGEYSQAIDRLVELLVSGDVIPYPYRAGVIANAVASSLRPTKPPDEVVEFLQALPLQQPAVVQSQQYWNALIDSYALDEERGRARQSAIAFFRICRFEMDQVGRALRRLFRVWNGGAEADELQAVATHIETGEGRGPLAEMAIAEVSDDQLTTMLAAAQRLRPWWRRRAQMGVYLYSGRYDEALALAEQMAAKDARGLAEIARCFKAKDCHLARANRYVEFMKTGRGENPLLDF
jgi:hypothetical protein